MTGVFSLIIICMPLSLVAGLRENVGTDYENYVEIIDAMKNYDYGSILKGETPAFIEPAFILLTKFCTSISPDSHFLPFFAYTFLTLFFSLLGFDRFGKKVNLPLAILLFYFIYYHVFLNIIRQGIAVALLIFSIKDLVEAGDESTIKVSENFAEDIVRVDEDGITKNLNGDYYLWHADMYVPSTMYGERITAVAFVLLDSGDYVFMQEVEYSVKTLAAKYKTHESYTDFSDEVKGALDALAK